MKIIFSILLLLTIASVQAQDSLKVAPNFTLQDINGQKVSLSDFKGKVVLIDFWATWCGPCLAEMPASKKLQKKFADSTNLVFMFVSIDANGKAWEKVVKSKNMGGIQLRSTKGEDGNIIKLYNVLTIPRYVIVDKNGNIAEYDAARPSEDKLAEDLQKLISQ